MKVWDLYDENREPLNRTHYRDDEMVIGEYHIVVEVWTVNDNKEILLTLRHPDKKDYPNLWENTGGSTLAGESSREGAARELFEETEIEVNENELFYLGTNKVRTAFIDTYIVRKNSKSELVMQVGETVDVQWVSLKEFDEMVKLREIALPVIERLTPLCEFSQTHPGGLVLLAWQDMKT